MFLEFLGQHRDFVLQLCGPLWAARAWMTSVCGLLPLHLGILHFFQLCNELLINKGSDTDPQFFDSRTLCLLLHLFWPLSVLVTCSMASYRRQTKEVAGGRPVAVMM